MLNLLLVLSCNKTLQKLTPCLQVCNDKIHQEYVYFDNEHDKLLKRHESITVTSTKMSESHTLTSDIAPVSHIWCDNTEIYWKS